MKLLCSSTSIGFIHSLRIALEGEGIETFCSDSDRIFSSVAGPMLGSAARLYVLDASDWPKAVALLAEMAEPEARPEAVARPTAPRWVSPVVIALISAVVAAVLAASR